MEGSGTVSRLDCYEDMFKEITRKLYGEDPDHRSTSNNFIETSLKSIFSLSLCFHISVPSIYLCPLVFGRYVRSKLFERYFVSRSKYG